MKTLASFMLLIICFEVNAQDMTPSDRARKLLAQMQMSDKISMVHGVSGDYVGYTPIISSLGIPSLHEEDGPQGVADGATQVTCWPSALTVVASWDVDLQYSYGAAMGREQYLKGTNIMLGPMINIARTPYGGRNFESYGEDPCLTATMVAPSIRGIQSQGVMACAKHWVNNNQEHNRTTTSAEVDERTEWEIYYPGFQAAVDAGVLSIMCSYNLINGTWACENNQTLNVDLKGRMGFQGFVMSDWGATHSTAQSANNGLDQEMPDNAYFGESLVQAVDNGEVSEDRLDDMVLRILTSMYAAGLFDSENNNTMGNNVTSDEHAILARQLSEAGTVLLKNDGNMLPFDVESFSSIAVVGDVGNAAPIVHGLGSGQVNAPYIVTPFQGIKNFAAAYDINVTYAATSPNTSALALVAQADYAIVVVGTISSEGYDRADLSLGNGQDELIAAVAAIQPNTIVVINTPGPVLMPWIDLVDAVVCSFMPGQEDGNALANILFGEVNPSGRLPITFPVNPQEVAANTVEQYPGIDNVAVYSEKLLVGYRWYDAKQVDPLFAFGHGLSYTTFSYSDIQIVDNADGSYNVTCTVTNNGTVAGAEVAQLYVSFPEGYGEPPQSLRGFKKFYLEPGTSFSPEFTITMRDLSIWNIDDSDWQYCPGTFTAHVGASSRDIRLSETFDN